MKHNLYNLYKRCLEANYIHVEHDGDYAIKREDSTLYLFLEWSHGGADWHNNFRFFAKPYKDMKPTWLCHRGFLRVWKSIEPYVKNAIMDPTVKDIVIVGYSHGAAIAGLAHEYVWFNRPDLRDGHLDSYGYGAPRFYWGFRVKKELRERWATYHPIRNLDDIVTHVPPVVFGFRHVNDVLTIGANGLYNCVDAHRQQSYLTELYAYEMAFGNEKNKEE